MQGLKSVVRGLLVTDGGWQLRDTAKGTCRKGTEEITLRPKAWGNAGGLGTEGERRSILVAPSPSESLQSWRLLFRPAFCLCSAGYSLNLDHTTKKHLLPSALSLTTARVLAQPVIWYTERASKALLYPQPLKEQSFQGDQRELQVFPSCWEEFRLTLAAVVSHTPQREVSERKEEAVGLMDMQRRVGKECKQENALQYYLGVLSSLP